MRDRVAKAWRRFRRLDVPATPAGTSGPVEVASGPVEVVQGPAEVRLSR